jgi:predicted dehydrogenase
MNATSKKYGKKLGVMHNQVFNPAFVKTCTKVKNGDIRRFLGMRILLVTSVRDIVDDPKHWAHSLPRGILGETAPHEI